MSQCFQFKAKVWIYAGPVAWHFVSLPKSLTAQIKQQFGHKSRGFGSLPIEARIGTTKWHTSVFYDSKSSCYMLPLKASVRRQAGIACDQTIKLNIGIVA